MNFVYYDFAKENLYFQVTIDGENRIYKIFTTTFMNQIDSSLIGFNGYDDKDEFESVINELIDDSLYDYNIDVDTSDDIVLLRTCSKFFGNDKDALDFIVGGRLLRDNERVESYSVRRNRNYEEVYEILKGDDIDDTEEDI